MEEKLQDIINEYEKDSHRSETKASNLRNKINFCIQHNFKEEVRITIIELEAIEMIVYRQGQTIKDLKDLLNSCNS